MSCFSSEFHVINVVGKSIWYLAGGIPHDNTLFLIKVKIHYSKISTYSSQAEEMNSL